MRINYKTNAIQLDNFYPNPIAYTENVLESEREEISSQAESKFSFMLGNSADPQNNHLVMLDALAHLKGSIKIFCVLSYAIVDLEYVEQVKKRGIDLFGDDFIALTEFMRAEDYKLLLSSIDFSCYYHNRQQAMGNIFHFLNMGKTVFIRGDIISFKFLQDRGLVVQDSNDLVDITLDQLALYKRNSIANKDKAKALIENNFSDLSAQKKWRAALRRVFALLKKLN